MQKFLIISITIISFISCKSDALIVSIPKNLKQPINFNTNSNESENKDKREQYFDLIHGNNANVDWQKINLDNFRAKSFARNHTPKVYHNYANNHLQGEWRERGSSNQAGNLRITDFDLQSNNIYAISDGGILWKSNLNGNNWTSLNDGFVLDKRVLKTIRKPDGTLRILAAIGYTLWYSDDEGQSWDVCGSFNASVTSGSAIDLVQLNDNDSTIIYLYSQINAFGNGNNKIAISTDHGASFQEIQTLSSGNSRVASMSSPYNSGIAYIIDENQGAYQFQNGSLTTISSNFNYSGTDFYQLESVISATDTTFYILTDKENLYRSDDGLATINSVTTLPSSSWECGIGVSLDNPDILYYGEVELFYSTDGGQNWNLVNSWQDYYGDVLNNIHADIMNIQTFAMSNGTEFTLIPNHGGLNISYDHLNSTQNISMEDLNIGQFYDVATSPINAAVVFGGTQDQGFQRTSGGIGNNAVAFVQVISGDYGQQQFTHNGQSIWTQYPGGQFSFYQNAMTDFNAQFWHDIEGDDMPNYDWIIPTGSAPNPSDDYILVGGGNVNGGSGSYLIKLRDLMGSPIATQFSFDFKAASGSEISAIETTPLDENQWYVSTANGFFYHSEDAGLSWTQSSPFGGPSAYWIYGADIYASRITPGLVFFGGSGYTNSPAFVSTDGGQSFSAIDNGLPSTMIHEMCMDPEEKFLFAATDAGPYVYSVAQNEWFDLLGNDAPIQEYITCEYVASENIVRFGTWGRGIWDFHIVDASLVEEKQKSDHLKIYPSPAPNGQFKIESNINLNCSVFDLKGSKVINLPVYAGTNPIDLGHFKSGTYILVFKDQDDKIIQKDKIVLQ